MQVGQRGGGDARRADIHVGAGSRIQHPGRDHHNHAGRRFNMDHVPARPALAVVPAQPATVQRMPPVVDDDLLPNMGRMTLDWPSAAKTSCFLGPMRAVIVPRSSTP